MADTELFERIQAYAFGADPEFANGLAFVLGHPETPASEAEMNRDDDLVLHAKCFFYARYAGEISALYQILTEEQKRAALFPR